MTREYFKKHIKDLFYSNKSVEKYFEKAYIDIDQIFDDHEAQLKAKYKEIERLRTLLMQSNRESVLIGNKIGESKARSIVAMLFWEWRREYFNHKNFLKNIPFYNARKEYIFKKAYAILKAK